MLPAQAVKKLLKWPQWLLMPCSECLGNLCWVDVDAVHGPPAIGEAYVMEAGDHLLQVDVVDEAIGEDILDDQAHIPDGLISCGLAHTYLVDDAAVTAGGG